MRAATRPGTWNTGAWPSRIGLAIVTLAAIIAAQSWFQPGKLLAAGDMSPLLGRAWLRELFTPWLWSGSNLGGPSANESRVPMAAVYLLVQALGGSSALCQEVWYTALFVGAAAACYLLLRALRIGPAGSVIGALAYVFNVHVVDIALNPVFLAAMVLLPGLPAVVVLTASGRRSLRWGVLLLAASAPLLGYVSQNPPLVLAIVVLVALMPPLAGWLDGRAAALRALRTIGLGGPVFALASAYWILPTVLQLKLVASATLANQSSWTWTEGRATLANGFWLNNDWGWRFAEYYPYVGAYDKFPLQVLIFMLPAAAFGFLALARFSGAGGMAARRARLGVAAAAASLFLVLFSMGTLFPGSVVFGPLYALPLGWLLREPGRFLMLGGLAYAVLLGLTMEAVSEWLKPRLDTLRRWRSPWTGVALRLGAIGALAAALLAPGFPLITGAVAPDQRQVLPSVHVSVPAYWTDAASYLNGSGVPGNVLLLPGDDFYQMPYTWGYYGADRFITDLITRNVVDPISQGYTPAPQELTDAVDLVQKALLAHDWISAQRALTAMGTPLVLVRGDVDAAFPGRHITPPAELEQALREDKDMRLIRSFGELELFGLRESSSPTGSTTRYVTVNSATPDLRDLSLFPSGTTLITKPMQTAVPAVIQLPAVSQWQVAGNKLETSLSEPAGWRYRNELLSSTGEFKQKDSPHSRTRAGPSVKVSRADGKVTEQLSYKLGRSVLKGGDIQSVAQGAVGNCDAFPGTTATARLAANALPGQGPTGQSALSLSANADSACVTRPLGWQSGPLFVSLWVRNVHGATPRICLFEQPADQCAAASPLPSNSGSSRWTRYQTIVAPDPGTRKVSIYLYADVYTPGHITTNEYSDVVVRKFSAVPQPVVVATPQRDAPVEPLYTTDGSYSSGWTVPSGAPRVEIDGLRNGWLGASEADAAHFSAASWYQMSRVASLVAVGLLLALALSGWTGGQRRLAAAVGTLSKRTRT